MIPTPDDDDELTPTDGTARCGHPERSCMCEDCECEACERTPCGY